MPQGRRRITTSRKASRRPILERSLEFADSRLDDSLTASQLVSYCCRDAGGGFIQHVLSHSLRFATCSSKSNQPPPKDGQPSDTDNSKLWFRPHRSKRSSLPHLPSDLGVRARQTSPSSQRRAIPSQLTQPSDNWSRMDSSVIATASIESDGDHLNGEPSAALRAVPRRVERSRATHADFD